MEGSTVYEKEWWVELSPNRDYELELALQEGIHAYLGVIHVHEEGVTTVTELRTERLETLTTDFTVERETIPGESQYLILLMVDGEERPTGRASFVLRTVS